MMKLSDKILLEFEGVLGSIFLNEYKILRVLRARFLMKESKFSICEKLSKKFIKIRFKIKNFIIFRFEANS